MLHKIFQKILEELETSINSFYEVNIVPKLTPEALWEKKIA